MIITIYIYIYAHTHIIVNMIHALSNGTGPDAMGVHYSASWWLAC